MNEQVISVLSKKWVIPAAVGVASFGSGLVAGYIWGKRNGEVHVKVDLGDIPSPVKHNPDQLTLNLDDFISSKADTMIPAHVMNKAEYVKMMSVERDIQVVNDLPYFDLSETGDQIPWDPDEEAEAILEEDELEEAVEEQMHQEIFDNDEDNLPEIVNVFDNLVDDDQWNYEDELSVRTGDRPYVISVDEFVADEAGCDQATVTYYAGDDIMADEMDVPIYDFNGMMGDLKFGHGSNDKAVVYIRNEKLGLEWEVLLHTGRFDVEVLGNDIEDAYAKAELKHSVPRFRDE